MFLKKGVISRLVTFGEARASFGVLFFEKKCAFFLSKNDLLGSRLIPLATKVDISPATAYFVLHTALQSTRPLSAAMQPRLHCAHVECPLLRNLVPRPLHR